MSDPPRILVVGGSGLVGGEVIRVAVGREDMRLIALSRRELDLPRGARMEVLLADPSEWDQAIAAIQPDKVICAIGTTIAKQDGDREKFASIDRDLVLAVASASRNAGATGFAIVSSTGADAHSKSVYLRTKGEMEAGLMKLKFPRLDVLRPGLLRGKREGDLRPLEKLGHLVSPVADLFLHGERCKYRSVQAADVAAAALQACREKARGQFVYHHDGILRLARRL